MINKKIRAYLEYDNFVLIKYFSIFYQYCNGYEDKQRIIVIKKMANSLPDFHPFDINTDATSVIVTWKNGFTDLIIF